MQVPLEVRDAQELFENLHLSASHVESWDISMVDVSESSAIVANIPQHKLESKDSRCSRAYEPIDEDEEIAKLISFFVNREPQHAARVSVAKPLSTKVATVALAPAVRYIRAKKAVAKQTA